MIQLGLVTTIQRNIGDDFIREGILRCIRELVPGEQLEAILVDKHDPQKIYPRWHPLRVFDKQTFKPRWLSKPIRLVAGRWLPPLGGTVFEDCALLIQCGTPVLWPNCRGSEWAGPLWRDVLARLAQTGKPVLNLGAGSCYPLEHLPETLLHHPDEAFVRLMLNSARLTTARDKLARQLFDSVGGKVDQLCCPALLAAQAFCTPANPTRKVLINFMAGGGHSSWGQAIDSNRWEQIMRVTVRHLEQLGWQPFLLAHNQQELALATALWPDVPRACPAALPEYFALARDAAFGIFNRLHACVALAGLGIPSVAVGTDSRNFMVEQVGLPALYVKAATPERLIAALNHLQSNREAESRRLLALQAACWQEHLDRLRPFFPRLDL